MLKNLYYEMVFNLYKATCRHAGILVLMYHEVQKDNVDIESWTVVRQSDFEKQMFHLLENYAIISLDSAMKLLGSGEPLNKKYFVITFDDGYSGNYEVVYPIIQKYNIPITIYVATMACQEDVIYWYDEMINILQAQKDYLIDLSNFNSKIYNIKSSNVGEKKWTIIQSVLQDLKNMKLEDRELAVKGIYKQLSDIYVENRILRHLTINEIHGLSESSLVTIGAHSHCHSILPSIPYNNALESIMESKHLLEEWTSKTVNHFSYPNGDYDENIVAIVKQSGFKSSVTTQPRCWKINDSSFEIPRLGIGRYDSIEKFKYSVMRPKA
jgi:peptidoglycan/xylan/chitin deacetylase (PgdA/CDA1 family)